MPIVITWAVLSRFAKRWAVPGALVVSVAAILAGWPWDLHGSHPWPKLVASGPTFSPGTLIGIAVPLFIVTMASQNLAGMSMLATFDYRPRFRPILTTTGAATMAVAPFGGHAVNLAAITAALAAGPDAHPDPKRRWIASVTGGVVYLVLGLSAGLAVSLIAASPPLLIEAVAGLALLSALGSALQAALSDPGDRDAAVMTLVVSASGIAPFGIGGAFWGLLAGLAYRAAFHTRATRRTPTPAETPAPAAESTKVG
jgi:benzoate membrane transport protein